MSAQRPVLPALEAQAGPEEDRADAADASVFGALEPPTCVSLSLAGAPVRMSLPGSVMPGEAVSLELGAGVVPGVHLSTVQVQFDEAFAVVGGSVAASVTIGEFVDTHTRLEISAGGSIQDTICDCDLVVGEVLAGTADVSLRAEGAMVSGGFPASALTLPGGLSADEGTLWVTIDESGCSGSGLLHGAMGGLRFMLSATLSDAVIEGAVELCIEGPPVSTAHGHTIIDTRLQGRLAPDGTLRAGGTAIIEDVEQGSEEVTAEYFHPDDWSLHGAG